MITSLETKLQRTHRNRFRRQTVQLWLRNIPVLLLAFGLSGVIAIAGNDASCSKVSLGTFGDVLDPWILRLNTINFVVGICGIFYLSAGLLLYFTGYKLKLREIQRKIFQPFFAPTLFVVAGYFLGIAAPLMSTLKFGVALIMAVSILVLATIVASIYEIFEFGASAPNTNHPPSNTDA